MNVSDYGGVRVEVRGSRYACLEGCDGIISYSDTEVRVRASKLRIRLSGRDLRIDFYSTEGIVVVGAIAAVEYGYDF